MPRDAQRLARHHGIELVGPHVELLDLVPVLRLVEWRIQLAESRRRVELEIFGLVDAPVTALLLRRTAAAAAARHVVADPVGVLPVARQIRMRAQSWCGP